MLTTVRSCQSWLAIVTCLLAVQLAGPAWSQQPAGQIPSQGAAAAQLTPEQLANLQAAQQQQATGGGGINPEPPFPPLNDKWQAYLDQVLTKWELESGKINKFECEFLRYQYEPSLAQNHAYTIAKGVIKYMKPDKGLFRVNQLVYYNGSDKEGKPQYAENPQKKFGEYWICDGQFVHVLDENEKKCTKYQLPPQMRGNSIHLSPLPFVFGVKKAELTARYWINPLPQQPNQPNDIWLEVYPRRVDDAANYKKVQVVIDLKDWLPKGMIVFLPQYREDAQHRELYQFENRVVNATNILPQIFQKEFIPADPPKDWKVIIEPYQAIEEPAPGQPPRIASPPVTQPVR